eukprot:1159211-Pelagomonas_calceolata.AAC.17
MASETSRLDRQITLERGVRCNLQNNRYKCQHKTMCNNCFDGMYFQCEQKQFNDFLDGFVPKPRGKQTKRRVVVIPDSVKAQQEANTRTEQSRTEGQ